MIGYDILCDYAFMMDLKRRMARKIGRKDTIIWLKQKRPVKMSKGELQILNLLRRFD